MSASQGPARAYRIWAAALAAALTDTEVASPLAKRPYDLRHGAVSTWLNAGVPPTQVAEWAGHSVNVLLRFYAKCVYGQDEVAKARIEAALARTAAVGEPDVAETSRCIPGEQGIDTLGHRRGGVSEAARHDVNRYTLEEQRRIPRLDRLQTHSAKVRDHRSTQVVSVASPGLGFDRGSVTLKPFLKMFCCSPGGRRDQAIVTMTSALALSPAPMRSFQERERPLPRGRSRGLGREVSRESHHL